MSSNNTNFETLPEYEPTAVVITDGEKLISEINAIAGAMFVYEPGELISTLAMKRLHKKQKKSHAKTPRPQRKTINAFATLRLCVRQNISLVPACPG